MWFDSDFFLSKHVGSICRSSFVQLREFRRVRCYLTTDMSILVANALISSCLDYCNSLFRSLSKLDLCKLQCIQNSAARIITNTCKFSSITPVLKKNCTGYLLHTGQLLKLPLWSTNSSTLVFHNTLILTSSYTAVATTLDVVKMLESS